jgi:hypothetical protein
MILKEEQRDLFSVPHGYYLAHCISADYALGAGVAKQIEERYGMKEMLKRSLVGSFVDGLELWDDLGPCCIARANVLNLITKKRCFHKPTLDDLKEALIDMRACCQERAIQKIAMPRIGCGLDRLNWDDVRPMIEEIFADTDIEIIVCVL